MLQAPSAGGWPRRASRTRSPRVMIAPTPTTMRSGDGEGVGPSAILDRRLDPALVARENAAAVANLGRSGVPVLHRIPPADKVRRFQVLLERGLVAVGFVQVDRVRILRVL